MKRAGEAQGGCTVNDDDLEMKSWSELDDSFGMITSDDTADFSGVVTLADDAFFDGIDYISPIEQSKLELDLDLSSTPLSDEDGEELPSYEAYLTDHNGNTNPIPQSSPKVAAVPSPANAPADSTASRPAEYKKLSTPTKTASPKKTAASTQTAAAPAQAVAPVQAVVPAQAVSTRNRQSVKDAYQFPDEEEGSSVGLIILAIVLALAVVGGFLWFIFGAKGCDSKQDETSAVVEVEDGDKDETPEAVKPMETDEEKDDEAKKAEEEAKKKEEEAKKAEEEAKQKEEEAKKAEEEAAKAEEEAKKAEEEARKAEEAKKAEEEAKKNSEPTQKWVEEQGHYENVWVVDKQAYDETTYETVQTVVHHDAEYEEVVVQEGYTETVLDDEGNVIDTIVHDPVVETRVKTPAWDETVTSRVPKTVHHDAEGHYEKQWVVDVEGHWETVNE